MNNQLSLTSASFCVACLCSDKRINHVEDYESQQLFHAILDDFEYPNGQLLLCYECRQQLNNALKFKRQVKYVQSHLINVSNTFTPYARLNLTKTDSFDYLPPKTNKNKIKNVRKASQNNEILNENKSDSENDYDDDVLPVETSQSEFLQSGSLQSGFLQSGFSQSGSIQSDNNTNQSGFLIKGVHWDIKVEAVDEKLELKTEIEDNAIEEVNLEENIEEKREDSFNDSDDEPLHNIKAVKNKLKKVKKEKKGRVSRERSAGVVSTPAVANKLRALNLPPGVVDVLVLSWDEVRAERQKALNSVQYTRQEFRCEHCVVGFNHRFKLDAHMKKHAPEAGDIECDICKTRFKTNGALLCHKRRHRTRWRCTLCNALYSRASVAADHSARVHQMATPTHTCHVCSMELNSLSKLRAHLRTHAEKQHCDQCGKVFPDKTSLRTHLFIHSDRKDFSCGECGKQFRFKKALEIHQLSHRPSELLYCVDCDMNFKNRISFYQHINYSMKHIHPDKIKHACEFCPRRFSKPSRLQEHRLSIHLKLAPHRCTVEGCTFASASRPALRTHTRMIHNNKKSLRNYICHSCGQAFTTYKILCGHVRSHTGERPYSCAACRASFAHHAALYNHNKLVHKVPFVKRRKVPGNTWAPEEIPEGTEPQQQNT